MNEAFTVLWKPIMEQEKNAYKLAITEWLCAEKTFCKWEEVAVWNALVQYSHFYSHFSLSFFITHTFFFSAFGV